MADKNEQTDAEVSRLRAQLTQAHKAMQSFIHTVSHDLGPPLRSVTGFSDILMRRYADKIGDDGMTYLGYINRGGIKAQHMLAALLRYSRIYTNGHAAERVDLKTVMDDAIAPLQSTLQLAEATVAAGPLPNVYCDRKQIAEVFAILFNNALIFRSPHLPLHIDVSAKQMDTHCSISVSDNGIGVPPQHSDRIFGMFQRLHSEQDYPGNGVGLAIASRIVERHGGHIDVRPNPDVGSVFTFTLSNDGPVDFNIDEQWR